MVKKFATPLPTYSIKSFEYSKYKDIHVFLHSTTSLGGISLLYQVVLMFYLNLRKPC